MQRRHHQDDRRQPANVALRPLDIVHLGAKQQIGERAVAAIPQRPQPADEQCRGVQQMRQVPAHQAQDPTGAPSRVRTAMPNSARPRLQPVMVGSSRRLTAIATIVSAAAPTNTHHSQPSHGAVHADTASVAITAMPTRTSTANAPARVGQAATRKFGRRLGGRRVRGVEYGRHDDVT